MAELQIWLNGKLVPASEATVSVFDHGLLYGDGFFEVAICVQPFLVWVIILYISNAYMEIQFIAFS